MYCIYSGKEIDETNSNIEHIIPLSLGGCDELTIRVEKDINSRIGSRIDGKLTQEVDKIPHNENDWLGHIMICDENKLIRKSWRDAIIEMAEVYNLLDKEVIEEAKRFRG